MLKASSGRKAEICGYDETFEIYVRAGDAKAIMVNPKDNVASAPSKIAKGEKIKVGSKEVEVKEDLSFRHKFAIERVKKGEKATKHGEAIGRARG